MEGELINLAVSFTLMWFCLGVIADMVGSLIGTKGLGKKVWGWPFKMIGTALRSIPAGFIAGLKGKKKKEGHDRN